MAFSPLKRMFTLLLLVAFSLQAQDFEESSRVLLREVRMHIVDKEGNHVSDLKPSDFSIVEDGQEYNLSFFEEVDRSKPVEEVTEYKEIEGVPVFSDSHQNGPRRLTLIIDTANMSNEYYDRVMAEMETFVFETVDPATMVQIVQIDGDIYPLTGYTPDRNQLREAFAKAEWHGKLYNQLKSLESSILNTISQSIMLSAANEAAAAEGAGIGRNSFNDENGGTYRTSVDLDVRQKAYFKQLHYRKFTVQMLRIAHALRGGKGSQSVLLVTGGQFIEEYGLYPRSVTVAETLSQAFNGVGIPLFTHLVKPKRALSEDSARLSGNLTLSGGPGHSWDYESLSSASTFDPNRGDRMRLGPYRSTVVENLYHMEGAPRYAAEWTGGKLTVDNGTGNLDQRMTQLFDAAGKYYRLGYTRFVDDVPSKVLTEITVRGAKENDWEVRYGKEALPTYGLNDRPEDTEVPDNIPEKPKESISRMMHLGEPGKNDLSISKGLYVFPGTAGEGVRIPVFMRLPKPPKPAKDGYEFGFAAIGEDGALLDHTVFGIDYGYDNESILFYDLLMPEKTPKEVRYFIREVGGETMSFESIKFEKEPPKITELLLSDVANKDFVVSPHHIRPSDKARAAADPLLISDSIFPFTPGDLEFSKPESLRFFFAVNDGKQGNPLSFEMWLENEDEDELVPPQKVQMLPQGEDGLKRFQGIIEAGNIPPGTYQLYVRLVDPEDDTEFMQSKAFKVSATP